MKISFCGQCPHQISVYESGTTPSFYRHYCSHEDELPLDSNELVYVGLGAAAFYQQPKWCPLLESPEPRESTKFDRETAKHAGKVYTIDGEWVEPTEDGTLF